MKSKFTIGDKVKVVKYGHPIWFNKQFKQEIEFPILFEDDNSIWCDINSEIVGKIGIVDGVSNNRYSLFGIPEMAAWYNEEQLEMVNANPNKATHE
jgi:hypothetical protein